jgi:hypothetical protein
VDISWFYGVLTALTAISSGLAGARAAFLSREAGSADRPADAHRSPSAVDISRVQRGVYEAISERSAGAQNAAAWLATSTALFGVSSTRPAADAMGVSFLVIGAILVAVAVQAILRANEAARLPPARAAFEGWYPRWIHSQIAAGARPMDEEVAYAFARVSPSSAALMRRFEVWPYYHPHADDTIRMTAAGRPGW